MVEQTSLFDEASGFESRSSSDPDERSLAELAGGLIPLGSASPWREVPQARYLSWPLKQQMAYCAARDRSSATTDPEHADFYLDRARSYEEMSR